MRRRTEKRGYQRLIHALAPLRINDIGGWTDTWFAREGRVLNLAVVPGVEVQVKVFPDKRQGKKRVLVHALNYGQSFWVDPEKPALSPHPLLQFTIAALRPPQTTGLEITIFSPVPAGISTGTSAAVSVALLGALGFLAGRMQTPAKLVSLAHRVETEDLEQQSGIQDQVCSVYGGACFIRMRRYPKAEVQTLSLEPTLWMELDRRLCLVYLGKPHPSSVMHEQVIARLEKGGPGIRYLQRLKELPEKAKAFLMRNDLESYGEIMKENNECQRGLLRELISEEAETVIRIARKHRASGWKVNGAGGSGGSLTVLANPDDTLRLRMLVEVNSLGQGIRTLPASLSLDGLKAWEIP